MIEFTPEQQHFIEAQVAAGGFKDPAEVVHAGLELLRKATTQDYAETVQGIQETLPDLEAGRGRTIEEVDAEIRDKLGFAKPS